MRQMLKHARDSRRSIVRQWSGSCRGRVHGIVGHNHMRRQPRRLCTRSAHGAITKRPAGKMSMSSGCACSTMRGGAQMAASAATETCRDARRSVRVWVGTSTSSASIPRYCGHRQGCVSTTPLTISGPCGGWDALCEGGVVAAAGLAAEPGWHPLVQGPGVPVTPLPHELVARTARCIHSGRPWDYIVQRGGEREPDAPKGSQQLCSGTVCTTGAYTMPRIMVC